MAPPRSNEIPEENRHATNHLSLWLTNRPFTVRMSDERGLLDWLEQVFFGVMELSFLSTPAFAVIVVAQELYPDAAPLAGLTAIAVGSIALALYRNEALDVGKWPRRGELGSLPLRVLYFSVLFFLATMGVAHVAVSAGMMWLTLGGGVVQALGFAAFPTVYRRIHGDPLQKPVRQL